MARKPVFKQMPLPFDLAELRKPARVTPVVGSPQGAPPKLPPGLELLAKADNLSPERLQRLLNVASTVRGKYPVTIEEWRKINDLISRFADHVEKGKP